MSHHTPTNIVTATIDIKKSEFISYGYPVIDREQAMFHVKQLREQYSDARHHCWAYIIGDPNNTTSAGFDDDGEPSGTAGRPILNVLQHKAIGNVIIIVVRYFGGIKLGAGGLTRAYGSSAQAVIDKMILNPYVAMTEVTIKTDYAGETQIRYLIEEISGKIENIDYNEGVIVTATIAERLRETLVDRLGTFGKMIEQT